jgi:hypothetical protein
MFLSLKDLPGNCFFSWDHFGEIQQRLMSEGSNINCFVSGGIAKKVLT